MESEVEIGKTTSRDTQLDSTNWLEDNLEFLGQALQMDFQGAPLGTCTKFLADKKIWCGAKAFKNSDRCLKHRNTDSEMINDLKKAKELERTKKVVVCRDVFRTVAGKKVTNKYVRYCPSIEGAVPAFHHSTNHLRKMLKAGFEVQQTMTHHAVGFFSEPFKAEFPAFNDISDQKWLHSFNALKETMRSYNFDITQNWTKYLEFLLPYCGAYQGWMDSKMTVPDGLFQDGLLDKKHQPFVNDLYTKEGKKEPPIAPAMNFRSDLNGLNTPSLDGQVVDIPSMMSAHPSKPWTPEQKKEAILHPTTSKPAPVMGELNNLIPPMYLDHDPNVKSSFETVVYIQAELRANPQLLRNKSSRGTAYDPRNDAAWHRRCDNTQYQVLNIVRKEDDVHFPVKSLDDLQLVDQNDQLLTQEYLDEMVDYLNGDKFIPGTEMSARNTAGHLTKGQARISDNVESGRNSVDEDVLREQNRALHVLDKTALTMINLTNRLAKARVGLVFITSGTGFFSADIRKNSCLLAEIPHAILKQKIHFKPVTDHFGLVKSKPRYIDYLDDDVTMFLMTLRTHKGRHAFKPTSAEKLVPDANKYTADQCRLYQKASNSIDICSNIASWIALRKNEQLPASEYVVALEGSVELWSHWASMSNMCEDYYNRPIWNKEYFSINTLDLSKGDHLVRIFE